MNMDNTAKLAKKIWRIILSFFEALSRVQIGIIILVGVLVFFKDKLISPILYFSGLYWQILLFLVGAITLLYIFLQVDKLKRRLTVGFQDDFREPLNKNWNYIGDWKIEGKNELSVSNSDAGGITNVGSLWENYTFELETKIINISSGWIVRATDLNNYIMFQCTDKLIRPHMRVKLPKITSQQEDGKIVFTEQVGWIVDNPPFNSQPHNQELKGWFKVKIVTRGSRVDIYIKDENVYHSDTVLTIPIGKVGFRNSGDEHAHFRNVRVSLN